MYYYETIKAKSKEPPRPQTSQAIRTISVSPLKATQLSPLKPPRKIKFGHEAYEISIPTPRHVENYISGQNVSKVPLRIVEYNKTGVKLAKISPEHSSVSVVRNVMGGFFSSA